MNQHSIAWTRKFTVPCVEDLILKTAGRNHNSRLFRIPGKESFPLGTVFFSLKAPLFHLHGVYLHKSGVNNVNGFFHCNAGLFMLHHVAESPGKLIVVKF